MERLNRWISVKNVYNKYANSILEQGKGHFNAEV